MSGRQSLRALIMGAAAFAASACAQLSPAGNATSATAPVPLDQPEVSGYADRLAARYASLTGDSVRAAFYWRKAFDQSPEDPALLERSVLALLIAGDGATARELAIGADPQTVADAPHARLLLALSLLRSGKEARALPILIALDGGEGAFSRDIAAALSAYLALADDPQAAIAMIRPREGAPGLTGEAFAVRGLLEAYAGRPEEARRSLSESWRRGVREPALVGAYLRLLKDSAETGYASDLMVAMERDAGAAAARVASVYSDLALPAGGAAAMARLVYAACSGLSFRSGPELMAVCPALALELDAAFDPAKLRLAEALRMQARSDAAASLLATIDSASPLASEAWIARADLHASAGRHALAQEAIASAQSDVRARSDRRFLIRAGDIMRRIGRHDLAEGLFSEAIAADAAGGREDPRLFLARAAERHEQGRRQEAEIDLLKALELDPDSPETLNFLGYSWVDQGVRIEEGFEMIRKAVEARPNAGYIVDSLGWAYFRMQRFEEAVQTLERAAGLSPSDPEIIDHLGDAYWRAGRHSDARYQWRRALDLEPGSDLAAALRSKLAGGLPALPAITSAGAER
jgi:tetratricopeptide (TPR) repeat protein